MNKNFVKTTCINGELQVGDLVLSTPEDEYSCLVGRVTDIKLLGDPDRDTENETDDVYVDFKEMEYSSERVAEIEEMFSDLYDEPKTMDGVPLDMTIMAPMCLIRVTDIGEERINAFLSKGLIAAEYCYNTLRKHPITDSPDNTGDTKIRVPYGSVWDDSYYVDTFAYLNTKTGEVTDIETVDIPNDLNTCTLEYVIIGDCELKVNVNDDDDTRWVDLSNGGGD